MGDLVEAVLIWRILKDLIAPFLVEHLGPRSIEWIEKKHKKRKTVQLDMPDQLIGLIDGGTVKPGKYVKGTAFFSLHTLGPATEQKGLHLRDGDEYFHHGTFDFNREQLWSSVSRTMSMEGGGPPDINDLFSPDRFAAHYSSMQLPLTNDVTRIGFLYPHNMFGFALPERHSGALPFQRRAICLVRQADLAGIENQIVRYRARVHMIGRSVFRDAFPLAGDDVYDHFRRQGFLYLLSIAEEDTFIEYYEQRMHEVIHGGHFIETHWEQPTVVRSSDFDNVLHKAIVAACEHVGAESPVREIMQSSQGKTGDRWLGQGFVIARPTIHPSINFQLHTDIASETAMNDEVRFNRMKEVIIDSINQHYGLGPGVKDINATHNYTASPHTILQSTAARQIRDPILSLVRNWLEKKKPD